MCNKERKLDEIQLLKGIAILLVFLVHSPQNIRDINPVLNQLLRLGRWGCQLFFVISGFLFTKSFFQKDNINIKLYYKKRIITILPAWYIAILFYRIIFWKYSDVDMFYDLHNDLKGILSNLFVLHGLDSCSYNSIVPGGWYIGTQWLIYLIAPFIWKIYKKFENKKEIRKSIPIFVLLFFGTIQICIALYYKNWSIIKTGSFLNYSILNQLPCFLIGMNLYYYYQNFGWKDVNAFKLLFKTVVFWFVGTIMYYLSSKFLVFSLIVPFLYSYGFYYFIILVFKYYEIIKTSIFTKVLLKLGKVSYAVYYTNFIWTLIFPWYLYVEKGYIINGTKEYVLFLFPMLFATYLTGFGYDIVLNKVSIKLKQLTNIH